MKKILEASGWRTQDADGRRIKDAESWKTQDDNWGKVLDGQAKDIETGY